MKVILLESLRNRGRVGDVVTVKDGYARNFLLPRRIALRCTAENLTKVETEKSRLEAKDDSARKLAEAAAGRLENTSIFVNAEARVGGQLYGSVRPRQIVAALLEMGVKVKPDQLVLRAPVRAVGRHTVEIQLHPQVVCVVHLLVGRSEADFLDATLDPMPIEERRDQALAILQNIAVGTSDNTDATGQLAKVAQLTDDTTGERAQAAVRQGKSQDFQDAVKEALNTLDVNCLVGLSGDVDDCDPLLIHIRLDVHGALATNVGNDRTLRLIDADCVEQADVALTLFALQAVPIAPVERRTSRAPDGGIGHITLRQTLRRPGTPGGSEPTEVWAMAEVNGACVHRRVLSFA